MKAGKGRNRIQHTWGLVEGLFGEDNPRKKKGESSSLICGTKGTRAIHMF